MALGEKRQSGVVVDFNHQHGYGTIRRADGNEILVHKKCTTTDQLALLAPGCRVTYLVDLVPRGLIARDVRVVGADTIDADESSATSPAPSEPSPATVPAPAATLTTLPRTPVKTPSMTWEHYVSQALLLRDQRRYAEVEQIYDLGLREAPSEQLVMSYASFERNRGDLTKALDIVNDGIHRFRHSIMLYRDAANLAHRLGKLDFAVDLLTQGIALGKGKIGLLHQLLGEAYARIGRWSEAKNHLALGHKQGFRAAPQTVQLVTLMLGPSRGPALYQFLNAADFKVTYVSTAGSSTRWADLVAQATDPEFKESFDLADEYIFRCFYKPDVDISDIRKFEVDIEQLYAGLDVNRELAFIALRDADAVYNHLYNRLFDARSARFLVPITDPDMAVMSKNSLRELLTHWLLQRDLYKGNLPVSGRRFFGRERILKDIQNNIEHGNHVGIFGLRKAGKTSVLYQIRDKNQQEILVYIDLLSIVDKDANYLLWYIGQTIAVEIENKFPSIATQISFRLFGRYTSYLDLPSRAQIPLMFDTDLKTLSLHLQRAALAHRPIVLLMIDEVERMLPGPASPGFANYHDFFSYIRGVSQEQQNLVSVVAGADPSISEAPQWDRRDNPMFNFYAMLYLPMLERHECAEMVTKIGVGMAMQYAAEIVDRIFRATGGHPFLTRQLCSYIAGRWRERPLNVTADMVDEAEEWFLFHESKTFEEIFERFDRDFPDEQRVLTYMAARNSASTLTELTTVFGFASTDALRHLLGYQLITQTDGAFKFNIDLLHRWLEKRLASSGP